jgi:quercetin dioxygenase-like cupin family protein
MDETVKLASFDNLTVEELFDGKVLRKLFLTRNIEIVEYVYKEGAFFPEHSHREEQVTIVESGKITFYLDGEEIELKEGDICYIPPLKPHSARVLGPQEVRTINVFHPTRTLRP